MRAVVLSICVVVVSVPTVAAAREIPGDDLLGDGASRPATRLVTIIAASFRPELELASPAADLHPPSAKSEAR